MHRIDTPVSAIVRRLKIPPDYPSTMGIHDKSLITVLGVSLLLVLVAAPWPFA